MNVLLKVFTLLGGLAFFLYGMNVMSGGLRKIAGGSLERSLKRVTANRFAGMGLGAVITIAIQSSSAMTVMLVGLVNSGIMPFDQTISVIMGSGMGTTVTNWITAMSGVGGEGWLVLLKPESFSPLLAIIGITMVMMSKKSRRQDIGKILVGFSILMYGMTLMSSSVSGLKDSPQFSNILVAFENPFLGLLVGTVFTGIIQSSAATVSIIQALSATGQISFGVSIPLILGANIGTCVTALISSIGVNRDAKKVSVIHIAMKIIGATVCMAIFYGAHAIVDFSFVDATIGRFGIAAIHTIFNVFNTILLFPLTKQLVKLANFLVRPAKNTETYTFLDERLLSTVSIAVSEASAMTVKMANLARSTILSAIGLCHRYDEKTASSVLKNEDELDMFEDNLGTFLVKLSSRSLSESDSQQVSKMLHTIGDLERLGDHAVNILRSAEEIHDKKIIFSEQARAELKNLTDALNEILELTIDSFCEGNLEMAQHVEPLEQVIDHLIAAAKTAHIERLQAGTCTIQTGFVLSDLLNNYERVSDHCSNIAVALIETSAGSFGTHEYLNDVKETGNHDFMKVYQAYEKKYHV